MKGQDRDVFNRLLSICIRNRYNANQIRKHRKKILTEALGKVPPEKGFESVKIPDYEGMLSRIVKQKSLLEEEIDSSKDSPNHQVNQCLRLLKNLKEFQKKHEFWITRLLIKAYYYNGYWKKKIKKQYKNKYKVIFSYKDCFLSYTNKSIPCINNDFSKLIKDRFTHEFFVEYRNKRNCLADVISAYLKSHNINLFFDVRDITSGDELKKKLTKYCRRTFSFVQLIEQEMFTGDDPEQNWPFKEYNEFTKHKWEFEYLGADCRKKYFPIATKKKPNESFPLTKPLGVYADWQAEIEDTHVVSISGAKKYSTLNAYLGYIVENLEKIRDRIINKILEIR